MRAAQFFDEGLGGLEAGSYYIFGRCGLSLLDQLPGTFTTASLDHHDGDVFATVSGLNNPTRNHHIEGGAFYFAVTRECYPLAID